MNGEVEHAVYELLLEAPEGKLPIHKIRSNINSTLVPKLDKALIVLSYHGVIDDSKFDEPRIAGTLFRDWYQSNKPIQDRITEKEIGVPHSNAAVYISYAWDGPQEMDCSREDIVGRLCETLKREGYNIKRDKKNLSYKGLISEFMQAIGQGDCIVVVISDKYLKSPFCMYELLEIYRHLQFDERICPIVLSDARLRTLADRLEYVAHWKEKLARIDKLIKRVGVQVLSASGSLKEYEKYREITFYSDRLITHLADINSLTPEHIAADNFDMLKHAIDMRLHQLQSP
jgi:hypothetical protein